MKKTIRTAAISTLFAVAQVGVAKSDQPPPQAPVPSPPVLFTEDFEDDLSRWEINDRKAIAIVDSGNPAQGRVLRLRPEHSTLYALIEGSEKWPAYRMAGKVLFPTQEHNYLGFIYNLRRAADGRIDLGSLYIKGNGSYIRVNPRYDWNPLRRLYEELKVPLTGDDAIVIGEWQDFALEVDGPVAHLYVGHLAIPKVTFPFFDGDSGAAGFKPRVAGGAVWIDDVEVTALEEMSYHGPMQPLGIEYRPERMVRDWWVLGPFDRAYPEVEKREDPTTAGLTVDGVEHSWRPFATDPRGAVVTPRVVDFLGPETVAYFAATIEVPDGTSAELEFSSIDDLTMWLNGHFEGYSYDDDYAWYDFGLNPDHPRTPYSALPLVEGVNRVLIRIRGGRYANGGFFAAVKADSKQEE